MAPPQVIAGASTAVHEHWRPGQSLAAGLPDDVHGRANLVRRVAGQTAERPRGEDFSHPPAADRHRRQPPGRTRLQSDLPGSRSRAGRVLGIFPRSTVPPPFASGPTSTSDGLSVFSTALSSTEVALSREP